MFENSELQRLFSQKTTFTNISGVKPLQTFIQNYPDDSLKPNLKRLLINYPQYRPVNGDGNCFYRAIMFLYLRQADLSNQKTLFQSADLLKCKNLPFDVSRNLTSQRILNYLWKTEIQPLAKLSAENREKKLQEMMNKSQTIDAILVAYFRVLNYDYLYKNKREIQPYTDGGIQNQLARVLTYGMQSEGVQIFSLSKILDLPIEIIMVHQQNLTVINYNGQSKGRKIQLFYRPGHYDIICEKQENSTQQASNTKKSFTEYYKQHGSHNNNTEKISFELPKMTQNNIGSRIISVSKPEEIQLVNQRTSLERNYNFPENKYQFRENVKEVLSEKDGRLKSKAYKPIQKKIILESPKNEVVEIKSANLQRRNEAAKGRMLNEAILCAVGITSLIIGFSAI